MVVTLRTDTTGPLDSRGRLSPQLHARQKLRATRQTNPKMSAFGGWDTGLFPLRRLSLCSCDVCSPFLMWVRLTRQFRGYPR